MMLPDTQDQFGILPESTAPQGFWENFWNILHNAFEGNEVEWSGPNPTVTIETPEILTKIVELPGTVIDAVKQTVTVTPWVLVGGALLFVYLATPRFGSR